MSTLEHFGKVGDTGPSLSKMAKGKELKIVHQTKFHKTLIDVDAVGEKKNLLYIEIVVACQLGNK